MGENIRMKYIDLNFAKLFFSDDVTSHVLSILEGGGPIEKIKNMIILKINYIMVPKTSTYKRHR